MSAIAFVVAVFVATPARADDSAARFDSLAAEVAALKKAQKAGPALRVSGVVQARWETAENSADTIAVAGGSETLANRERFSIRRARLKATYDGSPHGKAVVYVNGNDRASFDLLEAYVTVMDPWSETKRHEITIGQMNVPFGFDLEYSSSKQELLERSQAERTLFPGERDRGIKLESRWSPHLATTVGAFNGQTLSEDSFGGDDPNRNKALVARARVTRGGISAAASIYDARTALGLTGPDVAMDKTRVGLDAQVAFEVPSVGPAELRGEWFTGKQPNPDSLKALVQTTSGVRTLAAGADASHLSTDFTGWYVMAVQRFATHFQAAVRYDAWDRNADVDHDQFERLGFALHAFHGKQLKASVAYEIPMTDRAVPGGFTDPHDNKWTVQVQHTF